ncbi:MAG: nucleoside hydrolase [bacterium]|nr:nucleoside hydrolase [bacterium]
MTALPVIIDCDPGKDDAFALFLALALTEVFDVRAVTTVAGNVPVDRTARNARRIVEAAGCPDVPVFAGCARPMLKTLQTAEEAHGHDGLGGAGLPEPLMEPQASHAVTALIGLLDDMTWPTTIIALGPLTNIALVLIARPDLAARIGHLAVMGGTRDRGNVTDFAEFNIHVDPHAADVVLSVAAPVSLVTLDRTRLLRPPEAWIEGMRECGQPGMALASMWREFPVPLHDVAATSMLAWPDLFDFEPCTIRVETRDTPQHGRTIFTRGSGSARIVAAIDREGLFGRLRQAMERYATQAVTVAGTPG